MAVEVKQLDGFSFSITGLENHYDIEKSVYSALSLAALNLNKVGNYSLLIKSDGHHGLLISTDAPRDVIEPIVADIREKTARGTGPDGGPEYAGDVSNPEKAKLTSYTLPNLTGSAAKGMRAALWAKDMRTGGKNQQFTGVRAGIDGAGTASAVFRSDDEETSGFMHRTFDTMDSRQNVGQALREQVDGATESFLKTRLSPEAYRDYAKYEKWNDDVVLRSGKIRDIKAAIADASPREAVRMRRRMEVLQRRNSRDRKRLKRARTRADDNILAYTGDVGGINEQIDKIAGKKRVTTEDRLRVLNLAKKRDGIITRQQREEKKRMQLLSYEPGTPQYQDRMFRQYTVSEANKKTRAQWLKDNPNSKAAKDQRKLNQKHGVAKLKRGAGRALRAVTALAALGVGLLAKLYASVTDIGKNVAKQAASAMGFNMPYETMQDLNRFASSRIGLDPDIFSKMFSRVTASFSNPVALDTDAIAKLAPYLGLTTVRLTDFITKKTDRPDTIAYAIIDKLMQNTAAGIGGVQGGLDTDTAYEINHSALAAFDQSFADLFASWHTWIGNEERNGRTTLRQAAQTGIYSGFITPNTPEGGGNNGSDYEAARETQQAITEFSAGLKALKDDVLTKMLVYVGDLVAVVRNFVMKWFEHNNWFPEYVAAESAAAEAGNAEGRGTLTKIREDLEPAVQELAERYGRGATPEARKTDFLTRMDKVKEGDLSALPQNMSVNEYYNQYGGVIAYYQTLVNKLKEFDTAYDSKTGLTMHVNWSLDYISSVASGMASKALRKTRNTADKTRQYVEPGFDGVADRSFYQGIGGALRDMDIAEAGVKRGNRAVIAHALDVDRSVITNANQTEFKQRALATLNQDRALLVRLYQAIGPNGRGMKTAEGREAFTGEEKGRLDDILHRYLATYDVPQNVSVRSLDVPRTSAEAVAVKRRMDEQARYRAEIEAVKNELSHMIFQGMYVHNYFDRGWKATAQTDNAEDRTITIRLIDPQGREHVVTDSLPNNNRMHFDNVPVSGIFGQEMSTITETRRQRQQQP
jgi:hypothetical protein